MNASGSTTSHRSGAPFPDEARPGFRTKTAATRFTPEELAEIESAAEGAGQALSEWLRETALRAARQRPADPVELLLAELWAVRYTLLNLFHAGAQATEEGRVLLPESVLNIRNAPETTGKFVAATFEHDTARPVDGYAAPQLHTHVVIFNVTERDNGQTRALQPHEIFVPQRYATAVYRSELALRLERLGYTLQRGKHGQPEIKGYTSEYLEASSPRREQIREHLREQGIDGAAAAPVAAHHTRDCKELLSQEEVLRRHRELAAQYGNQAEKAVAQARQHERSQGYEPQRKAQQAITWARDHVFERSAVQDRRAILEAALARSMGETTYTEIRQEFERRAATGEFREIARKGADRQFTTAAMVRMERTIIARMQEGNWRGYGDAMLVPPRVRISVEGRHSELSASQRQVVDDLLVSREKIVGLDGVASAGKTTVLSVIREGAEAEGYRVEGFAPTSRAAQKLAEAGMETSTLQKHLARGAQSDTGEKRLYVLDESSLASARQVHDFHNRLHPNNRVLLVGDRRQHEAVEAGRPFAQLQEAGMKTVRLEEIVRQKDPELKHVVEQLARGEVEEAIGNLSQQGQVHEIQNHGERITAIAREYAKASENTLVVSPDNRSRIEINERIHAELQDRGVVNANEHSIRVLVPRQNMTGADRTWAERYEVNDVLRYARASKETGIGRGEYARVRGIDAAANRLTVEMQDKTERTCDTRRQQGVSVFREEQRDFSIGDRIQFTAPANDLKTANRELGTIQEIPIRIQTRACNQRLAGRRIGSPPPDRARGSLALHLMAKNADAAYGVEDGDTGDAPAHLRRQKRASRIFRATDGVITGYVKRSTLNSGRVKQAKFPETRTRIPGGDIE